MAAQGRVGFGGEIHRRGAGIETALDLRAAELYHEVMGKTYLYECGLCHYSVRVSGGSAAGVNCETQTVLCRDCRELFDVFRKVRRQSSPVGKFRAMNPEIPPAGLAGSPAKERSWEKPELACPMEYDKKSSTGWKYGMIPGGVRGAGITWKRTGWLFGYGID